MHINITIRSTKPIMFISFLDVSYVTISDKYFCKYTSSDKFSFPTRCSLQGANFAESCQNLCSSYDWCIGYSQSPVYCGLITSTGNITCEQGIKHGDNTATSVSQLEVTSSSASGFSCIVKSSTGNKRLQVNIVAL